MCFLDAKKAFDRVNHWTLAKKLLDRNVPLHIVKLFIIIIIIIKRGWQCKAGRERLTPYQSEDPNPTTPTHRKKEDKGKTVGDKK